MESIAIINKQTFKNKELNKATGELYKAFQNIEKSNNEACKILARVEKEKLYKDDGFKSLAEYAEQIGLEKSTAHKMENAGRLMISENEKVREFAAKADYSKLAMLASEDEKAVEKAIEDGVINEKTTQRDVKKWKDGQKTSTKAKVLPRYDIDIVFGNGDTLHIDNTAIETVEQLDGYVKIGVYKEENKPNITICYNPATGKLCRYTAEKVVKAKGKTKPQLTDEQIKSEIERYKKMLAERGVE